MDYVLIVEAAQHMDDGIRLADVRKELVPQSFSLAGTLDETGYINYLYGGGNDTSLRFTEFAEFDKTLVGHGDDAYIGFNRAEREIGALRLRITKTIEKGGFADIRQPYYSALQ